MLEDCQETALNVLKGRLGEEMTVRHVFDALDGEIPASTLAIALAELAHRGLVHRRSEVRSVRKRSVQWYRAVD